MNIQKLIKTVQRLADGQSPANVETRLDLEQVLSILVELSGGPKAANRSGVPTSTTRSTTEVGRLATAGSRLTGVRSTQGLILSLDDTPQDEWEGRRDLAIQRQIEDREFD